MKIDALAVLPQEVRDRLDGQPLPQVEVHRGRALEVRRVVMEVRDNSDGTVALGGYASTFEQPYDVAGGPPAGWSEVIAAGAFTKALREGDDVRFLVNHEGLPLARWRGALDSRNTMTLTQDDLGLLVDVPTLDLANPQAQELASALRRQDADQMSFGFQVMRQEWNEDFTVRRILEVRLFDVSAVTYPANEATVVSLHSASPSVDRRDDDPHQTSPAASYPLSLAMAEAQRLG